MEFEKRLERAIQRGERVRDLRGREELEKAMSEEEFKHLHSTYRLELTDHVEACLRQLGDHFPGFRYETVIGEDGWGAKVSRDDLDLGAGRSRKNLFSRLEMLVRPYSSAHIIELAAKGTIRNREVFNRTHFQFLSESDLDSFRELIDLWILEYAEQFASQS